MNTQNDIQTRISANFSLLSLVTPEESRAVQTLTAAAIETGRKLFVWSITKGLQVMTKDAELKPVGDAGNPAVAAAALAGSLPGQTEPLKKAVVVLLDFTPYLRDPVTVRAIRDALPAAKLNNITGIFVGPQLELPPELTRECAEVDMHLPDATELESLIDVTYEANSARAGLTQPEGAALTRLVDSARGLTIDEAENALALSLVRTTQFDHTVISAEKARAVKSSGALEILKAPASALEGVGGLDAVKEWVRTRGAAFNPEAKAYGLPAPKGALLVGVQGCGKSLIAKAAGAALGLPVLRLDLGSVFGGLVGQSEAQMRAALKTIDAVAPCVVMIDELEKAFAGMGAGKGNDGGTGSRVLGSFLTWTQERESPVFLMATANNIESLPPELLRRGRWDTMMFVDLPTPAERAEILRIQLVERKRDPSTFDLTALAEAADGFSGAELAQSVTDAMFEAFADKARQVTTADVLAAIRELVPLSRSMPEPIHALRKWAESRCVPASGRPRVTTETTTTKRVARKLV